MKTISLLLLLLLAAPISAVADSNWDTMLWNDDAWSPSPQTGSQYYTFAGQVKTIHRDDAGAIAAAGLSNGGYVTYTLLIDFNQEGTQTAISGDIITYPDTATNDYFFVDYIQGSALEPVDGGYYTGPTNVAEFNYGLQYDTPNHYGTINANSQSNQIYLHSAPNPILVSDWMVGDTINVINYGYDSDGNSSMIQVSAFLVDISETIPALDTDNDGVPDSGDNCPFLPNADQWDGNSNGIGDLCEIVPMYYTFSGPIHTIYFDDAGAIANADLELGDTVDYTFLLDFNGFSLNVYNTGIKYFNLDTETSDCFFADYIGGAALEPVDGGYYNGDNDIGERNNGYQSITSSPYGSITGNSDDAKVSIGGDAGRACDWVVGDVLGASSWAYDSAGNQSLLQADVTLVEISDLPPVSALNLYGIDSDTDSLHIIDLLTGDSTVVGRLDPTGDPDPDISPNRYSTPFAMAVRPSDSTIFAWNLSQCSGAPGDSCGFYATHELITINPQTGEATAVTTERQETIQALAFDPLDETLFGFGSSFFLYTVDTATGVTTEIGEVLDGNGHQIQIYGADFNTSGILYGAGIDRDIPPEEYQGYMGLYTINTATANATFIGSLSEPGDVLSIVFAPDGNLLAAYWWGSSSKYLCDLDPDTAVVSNIRPTSQVWEGLGFALAIPAADSDSDGVPDIDDNCPDTYNPLQVDSDGDGVGEMCDPCPADASDTCNQPGSGAYIVDEQGGTVSNQDGSCAITVEPGAVDTKTTFSITDTGTSYSLGTDLGLALSVLEVILKPGGVTFNQSVTIRLAWEDDDNNGVIDGTKCNEADLFVVKNGEVIATSCVSAACGCLNPPDLCAGCRCDLDSNYFEIDVTSFSDFALAVPLDSDEDGVPDYFNGVVDGCPNDPGKVEPGQCGCGNPDIDIDDDGTADCNDDCPNDPGKVEAGQCGCGTPDSDSDSDGIPDCNDNCPQTPNPNQEDTDNDGIGDACDNTPPIAAAGFDQTAEAGLGCEAGVTLDGSASYDPDGDELGYTWTWSGGTATGMSPTVQLSLGATEVSLVVNDGTVDSEPDTVVITVQDTTPPELTLILSPKALWPPNHKMVEITPFIQVDDFCCDSVSVALVAVTTTEGTTEVTFDPAVDVDPASGFMGDDIQVIDGKILLRAERPGRSQGRFYTLTYRATDCAGNESTVSGTVVVPHDWRKRNRFSD